MHDPTSLVIFSDLDGTLLDHDTYAWDAARPALDRLAALKVPVVLASSKTAAEIRRLQTQMKLQDYPAIVENGAGLLRAGEEATAGVYTSLRRALDGVPNDLRACFTGFGDMTDAGVARVTGLSRPEAALARKRQFSEPGLWTGTDEQRAAFLAMLEPSGISATEGGRFLTLSFGATKKDRMDEVSQHYAPAVSVALGDAPNDVEMLEHADFGFIVTNPHRVALPRLKGEDSGRIQRTTASGPQGWNDVMTAFLDNVSAQEGEQRLG